METLQAREAQLEVYIAETEDLAGVTEARPTPIRAAASEMALDTVVMGGGEDDAPGGLLGEGLLDPLVKRTSLTDLQVGIVKCGAFNRRFL